MNKKILKRIGILSLGLLCAVGIVTGVSLSHKNIKANEMIVNTDIADNSFKLTQRKYANNPSQVTITASVEAYMDTTLTWTNKFVDGTDASSYVTMSVASNTKSVTLNYLKPFNRQIKITACVTDRTSVSATCVLDCYTRNEFDGMTITGLDDEIAFRGKNYGYNYGVSYGDLLSGNEYISFTQVEKLSTGTIATDVRTKFYFQLSEQFVTILNNNNISCNSNRAEVESEFSFLQQLDSMVNAQPKDFYGYLKNVDTCVEIYIITESYVSGTNDKIHTSSGCFEIAGLNFDDYYNSKVSFDKTNIIF